MKKLNSLIFTWATITFLLCLNLSAVNAQQLAFPGAEGFGALATGGRGGTVVHVTNLNESGPGSFADAVSQPNRIVVFDVGGIIKISPSTIITIASNITVAGQTAPGGGITIYGNRIVTNGSNIILRFLRMRGSILMPDGKCTVTCDFATNIIYDHCSISWGRWDNVHITNSKDITFQYCIIGEGIDPQRFGAITDGTRNWTVSHCLWINNSSRNPKMKCFLQYFNNVVYNYGNGIVGGHSAADNYQDVFNNYFIAGPSASGANYLSDWTATDHLYSSGNYIDLNKDGVLNGELMTSYNNATVMQTPLLTSPTPLNIESAADAYRTVLRDVGASLVRDVVDERLINQLSSLGTKGAIIHSETEVNGPGIIANGTPPLDTDRDGMPNSWELSKGLNPSSAADGNGDIDGNGYTNIEDYLNYLANTSTIFRTPNLAATTISKTEIDLSWTIASNAQTGFIIEKSLNNIDWIQIADLDASVSSYKDLGLTSNTIYYYRIKAYNSTQSSDYAAVFAKTQSDSPTNPSPADNAEYLDSAKVVFKWNASNEVTSYNFYLGTDPANITPVATGLTAKTYTALNLKEGKKYYWRVDGITANGTFPSNIWSFTTRRIFPAGMVGWYKLDDGDIQVADSSKYHQNGFLIDVDTTAWQPGLFNGCLNSTGADPTGHIEIQHSDPLFVDKGSLGISFWMKSASQNAVLFEKFGTDAAGVSKGYTVELTTTALKITLLNGATTVVSSATLPANFFNRWNHVVINRDTTIKRIRIFINATMIGNLTTTSNMDIGNSAPIYIANNSALAKPYQGLIDDVRFYNNSFYTNNQVNILYNAYPAPDRAAYLFPAKNDSCYDNRRIPLTWLAGPNSFNPTFDVYLGTDPGNLQLKLSNLTTTKNVVIPGTLSYNTQYYWRVDSKNNKGTTAGEVWSFRTKKMFPQGLAGSWKLDETTGVIAADSSIYKNNGTINLLTGNPIRGAGHLGNGLNFSNGRDSSHIAIPFANQLYNDINPFSISLWMKIASAPAASTYLIHKGTFVSIPDKGTNGKWYGLEIKGGNFTFAVDDDVTKTALSTSSAPFCTGQWVHVVAVRDTVSKKLILYRNGALVSSLTDATGSISTPENLYLANVRDLNAPYFGGLDEVRLYNYAITPTEVATLYNEDPRNSKPVNLLPIAGSTTSGIDSVTISWNGDANTKWYNVYFGADSTNLALIASKISAKQYLLTQLSHATKYFWRIEGGNNTYKVAGDTWSFTTNRKKQAISFNPLSDKTFGDQPFAITADGGVSGKPVTFSIDSGDAVTIADNIITIVKAGSVVIKASQEGDANYLPSPDVLQKLTIAKAPQTMLFPQPLAHTYGDVPFELQATGGLSGVPVTFSVDSGNAINISGNTATIVKAGSVLIRASQTGNDNYLAAPDVLQLLIVKQASQSIVFLQPSSKTYGDAPFELSATGGNSGNPVIFSIVSGDAVTLEGNTVTLVKAGAVEIKASQSGNSEYLDAPDVIQTLTVEPAGQIISFTVPTSKKASDAPFDLVATGGGSGNPITFSIVSGDAVTLSGSTVTIVKPGSVQIKASQAGDERYLPATEVIQTLIIGQPPVASFTADPTSGFAPLVVSFDASASTDADHDFLTYGWEFGDGATASGITSSHTYSGPGNYTAILTVTDARGDISHASAAISAASGLKAQYRARANEINPVDNHIKPHFQIVNTSNKPIPYSELSLRYWFTSEGNVNQVFWCDYALLGTNKVKGAFATLASPSSNADHYLEVSFTSAGSIAPGGNSGEIQTRFNKVNWSNYSEAGDYSYDPSKTNYQDWSHVTLYRNGILFWGTEPANANLRVEQSSLEVNGFTATVSPNPAQTETSLRIYSPKKDKFRIRLMDITGRTLINTSASLEAGESKIIPVSISSTNGEGIYILKVINSENKVLNKKVIKQ